MSRMVEPEALGQGLRAAVRGAQRSGWSRGEGKGEEEKKKCISLVEGGKFLARLKGQG